MSQIPIDVTTIVSLALAIFVVWRLMTRRIQLRNLSRWDWGLYWTMVIAMAAAMGLILFTEARESPISETILVLGSLALGIAFLLLARALWQWSGPKDDAALDRKKRGP